jgi:hypothetical protein
VNASGLVTAVASGTVVIQATNDGTAAIVSANIVLSSTDSDGDGIPDDVEINLGLNPNNPVDAQEDFDRDGLTNLQEISRGTGLRNSDSDGDGLSDGDEVNQRQTNPLLADTDGDLIPDGVEVQTGTNPLDRNSFDLSRALRSIDVTPSQITLVVNSIIGQASQQLTVNGHLIDGRTTINLTARSRGTNYNSNNLAVANFGIVDGLVFAGIDGTATINVTNSGFSATAQVAVSSFAPTALSFVSIPGFANNVDVSGNFAYVAAGSAGLQVVDVTDRRAPRIVGSLDTPGNANDVRVVGNRVYIADGAAGLQIINVNNPNAPTLLGSIDTSGEANDVVIMGNRAYVADGSAGLQIIDVSNPQAPSIIGTFNTPGNANGVDVSGNVAIIADGNGVLTVDISNAANLQALGNISTTDARDLSVDGTIAYLADFTGSLRIIDFSTPTALQILATTQQPLGGILTDVAKAGSFVLGADVLFVNGVPIVNVDNPAAPVVRARLDFPARDDNGTGIAVDNSFVYLSADISIQENGVNGDSRLYIGQYLSIQDRAGIPPVVSITSPAAGSAVIEGSALPINGQATDDVQVASVDFLVNGVTVFTDSVAPYQFSFTVPTGITSLTLGAKAFDIGGNVGTANDVRVNVIPDPGTTVIGRVIDRNGAPISGANVTTIGQRSALTGADGAFSIVGVPTIAGDIVVDAQVILNGLQFRGRSASVPPVVGGITSVGDITVRRGKLYGSSSIQGTNPGSLFIIDKDTGVATLVGNPSNTPNGLSDVSVDPATGTVYAIHGAATRGAELLTLDSDTAAVLTRVPVTNPFRSLSGSDALAHDFSGNLYAGGWSQGRLLRINPSTGVVISDLDVTNSGGNNHLADLSVDPTTGQLWATRGNSDGNNRQLIIIDPATGAATFSLVVATTRTITAIAFDSDGTLFASLNGDQLAVINKTTGAVTLIGTGFGGPKIAGLGFEP